MTRKELKLWAEQVADTPYEENRCMLMEAVIDVAKKLDPKFKREAFVKMCVKARAAKEQAIMDFQTILAKIL